MKNLQIYFKPFLLLLLIGFAFNSCNSDESNNNTPQNENGNGNENENPTPTLVADYTFTQVGGVLDGETFTNTISHELNSPPVFKEEGVNEQFDSDRIEFMFTDIIGETTIKLNMFIMLDADKNPQPLGDDLSTESTITLIYSNANGQADPAQTYSSMSESGSFSFIDINIEEPFDWNPGIAPATFNVNFTGTFRQSHFGTTPYNQDVEISGNIKVYRTN